MVVFDRPIGPHADMKEIEYISALHQSGNKIRNDGSIRDDDIKTYLRSRFGIEVTLEEVRSRILQGFGGGSSDEEAVVDLMELTAIILIPLLRKAAILEGKQCEDKHETLPHDVLPPPENLLSDISKIILHDVTGGHAPVEVTKDFVTRICLLYGEKEMAADDTWIEEMVEAAGGEGGEFNAETFSRALTNDVLLYDIAKEGLRTNTLQDVFVEEERHQGDVATSDTKAKLNAEAAEEDEALFLEENVKEDKAESKVVQIEELQHVYTAPAIDIQAGTYRSKVLAVCLWGSVLFGLFTSSLTDSSSTDSSGCDAQGAPYVTNGSWRENRLAVGCNLSNSVFGWVIRFLVFCFVGMLWMGVGSLGNFTGNTRWYLPMVAATFLLFFTIFNYVISESISPALSYVRVIGSILTGIVVLLHLGHAATLVFQRHEFSKKLPGANGLGHEKHVKSAGAHKLNVLTSNARNIFNQRSTTSAFNTYFGHGLSTYSQGPSYEEAGGIRWLWRRIRDETIFSQEGVWYSTRLVASNMSQVCLGLFILLLGTKLIRDVKTNFEDEQTQKSLHSFVDYIFETEVNEERVYSVAVDLSTVVSDFIGSLIETNGFDFNCSSVAISGANAVDALCELDQLGLYNCTNLESPTDSLCAILENPNLAIENPFAQFSLLEAAGFDVETILGLLRVELKSTIDTATESLFPEELYMLTVPLGIGVFVAILAAARLTALYLPSVTTTIIQLRTGVIPSLHSEEFEKYRVAPDTVTLLTGSLFWGCFVSSILFGAVVGLVAFIFLWQGSTYFVMRLIVIAIGVIAIIIVRLMLVTCCRVRFYKGLYRTRPARANIYMMALEWANYVFTSAFILVRMVKLVLISVSCIGQIDRPFLAEGVGRLGPLELDPYPTIHLRDLVAHEAHRHPYIEILGKIYLMKLRYAKDFGNRAGSSWRLMFVYALLPWMHKYRIFEREAEEVKDSDMDEIQETNSKPSGLLFMDKSDANVRDSPGDEPQVRSLEVENERLKQQLDVLRNELSSVRQQYEKE